MSTTRDFLRHLRTVAARQAHAALSDRQLLERFLHERSEASFSALVARHGPMVLSVCRRVLQQAQDAEDAFQATFLVLARKAGSIRKQASLGSWLHGVAYRTAECLKAKAHRRAAHERRVDPLPPGDGRDDITWRELRAVLDEELQRLPEQYRAPLVLCYLEARTQDEAARHLGWSKNTFTRRMNQARKRLAQRLTRRGLSLPAVLTAPLLIDGAVQAALPPVLAANTVRAGLAAAMGNMARGMVSVEVIALAQSGAASLLMKKSSAALVLLATLMLCAGGLLAHRTPSNRSCAEPPPPARSTHKDTAGEINGRVLGPDGKPVAGACLFLRANSIRKKMQTNKDGRFRFPVRPADFGAQGKGELIATAEGLGLDWIDVNAKGESEDITLQLVADDAPILGRVLDLEGKPIADVTVEVCSVSKRADGKDLTDFVGKLEKYLKEGTPGFPNENYQPGPLGLAWDQFQWKRFRPTESDVPATVTTGKDGRFRLTGFGRERVLQIVIHGSTIAQTRLRALTRTGPPHGWMSGHFGLYGCRLDYLASPCKPIVGTVRDKRSGKPIAGITVGVCQQMISETKTDSQGHYRILGAAKSKEYEVDAGGMPYFNHAKHHIADTAGLAPITVDFELERGIVVQGRLTDKSSGKPVQGEVHYKAEPDNPNVKDYADAEHGAGVAIDLQGRTKPDGSFAVLAIPGPGLLHVQADEANRFVRAEIEGGAFQYHAEARINPSESDPRSTTCNIALEAGRELRGSVAGPDGKPLAGVYAAGRWPVFSHDLLMHEKLESDAFRVGGIKAGRPRTLVFFHPEKKLGKVVKLQGDETKPLPVRLGPLDAALRGRILDAKGRPWPGLTVSVGTLLGRNVFRDASYPPEFLWGYTAWMNLDVGGKTTTDGEGGFRITGLMPDLKYVFFVRHEAYDHGNLIVTIDSGKTKDVGDLKIKRSPEE